jgi:hypothetical protein
MRNQEGIWSCSAPGGSRLQTTDVGPRWEKGQRSQKHEGMADQRWNGA